MSQRTASTSKLLSLDTAHAEIQCVASCDSIALDIQAYHYNTDGREQRQYALAHLTLRDAARLRNLLNEAIAAAADVEDPRQSSLWSNATAAAVAEDLRRGLPA